MFSNARTDRRGGPELLRGMTSATLKAPSNPVRRPAPLRDERIAASLALLGDALAMQRRIVHPGDPIYRAGERFASLCIVNSGFVKIVNLAADGREQVVGLKFRGDWLGFDGIAHGEYACDTIALDTGEVWVIRYDALIAACPQRPALLCLLHEAMSREIGHNRDSLMSVCTLPADARVAEFLRLWAESSARRGLRNDQITLRMTRAEIGNYLGMTLESVSRALSKLALSRADADAAAITLMLCARAAQCAAATFDRARASSSRLKGLRRSSQPGGDSRSASSNSDE
jgi:CRP/FNR family transcriptional regulator